MYVRSLHLAADRFTFLPRPPLATSSIVPPDRFGSLINSLQACSSAPDAGPANQLANDLANEASIALFCIFIDTLALLIGEHLTSSILRSAWGNAALDLAEKETHQ